MDETPANECLGEIALRIAPAVRLTPAKLAGEPVDRVPIRIPINFQGARSGASSP